MTEQLRPRGKSVSVDQLQHGGQKLLRLTVAGGLDPWKKEATRIQRLSLRVMSAIDLLEQSLIV